MRVIETAYKGYRFRSRLEARWAVFFDALGIDWEYEKEGFDLGEVGWYLPDFWLPQVNMWAEVKPGAFTKEEVARCEALARETQTGCLFLDGTPAATNYWGVEWEMFTNDSGEREGGLFETDYVMGEGHCYHLCESRFYSSTGATYPEKQDQSYETLLVHAVEQARGVRGLAIATL